MFVKMILYILIHTLEIKKSNKRAFFVIDDTILSLTLKGKCLSIKIMEVDVQSILFQHPCNIFITGPSARMWKYFNISRIRKQDVTLMF